MKFFLWWTADTEPDVEDRLTFLHLLPWPITFPLILSLYCGQRPTQRIYLHFISLGHIGLHLSLFIIALTLLPQEWVNYSWQLSHNKMVQCLLTKENEFHVPFPLWKGSFEWAPLRLIMTMVQGWDSESEWRQIFKAWGAINPKSKRIKVNR